MKRLTRAADEVKDVENLLAVAETVEHPRRRAEIVRERPDEDEVTVDAVQLRHNDADVLRAPRRLDARQLFNCERIAEIIVHRGHIVEPIRIRQPLDVRPVLKQFFNPAVEIAHDGRRL